MLLIMYHMYIYIYIYIYIYTYTYVQPASLSGHVEQLFYYLLTSLYFINKLI